MGIYRLNNSMDDYNINIACVIHGNGYSWEYVDKLYNMVSRNLTVPVVFHVYTEESRDVPEYMIKHSLIPWNGIQDKYAWWYKMQLFNSEHYSGPLLYFDLDVVITDSIDWVWQLPTHCLWAIKDFKALWRPNFMGINSSMMWWDTTVYHHIWKRFSKCHLPTITGMYKGDQDYLSDVIPTSSRRFFEGGVKSWRWEVVQGGYDFALKSYRDVNAAPNVNDTSVIICHGEPKPHQINDQIIFENWR